MLDARTRATAEPLPEKDEPARRRERHGDEEEQEPGGEALVGGDARAAEEAHEEGLAHREAVQRERHKQDEEEQRPHHVVEARPDPDADRARGSPDREDADRLDRRRPREDSEQQAWVPAKVVYALVKGAHMTLDAQRAQEWYGAHQKRPDTPREEQDHQHDRPDHECYLEPEVGTDVVTADR